MYPTRVRFKDGTEENETWEGLSPYQALCAAVRQAEEKHGEPHDGAWLWLTVAGREKDKA